MWEVPRRLPESVTPQRQQPIRPAPPACGVPLPVPLHPHTTPASTAPPTRPAAIATMVQTLPHTPTPLHILCPPAYYISRNTMVQTGLHPNELRLRFLARYISMNSDPHPPSSLAQPPPSHAPTGPSAIQPKHPVDKSPKVYTQLAREGVVLTQDSDNI